MVLHRCIAKGMDNLHPSWRYWNVQKIHKSKYYMIYAQMQYWLTKNNDFTLHIAS